MFSRIRTLCCDRDFQASNTTHTTHRCSQKQAPLMHDRLHAYIHTHHTHHTQHTQHMLHLALARRTSVEEHLRVKGLPTLLSFICPCCGLNIPLCISAFPLDGGVHSRRQFGDVRIKGAQTENAFVYLSFMESKHRRSHVWRGKPVDSHYRRCADRLPAGGNVSRVESQPG